MSVSPGAEPFVPDAGPQAPVGVVLCHGSTGASRSVRPWVRPVRGAVNHIVEPVNGGIPLAGPGLTDKTETVLPDSYHVATLDDDAETIFADRVEFLRPLILDADSTADEWRPRRDDVQATTARVLRSTGS